MMFASKTPRDLNRDPKPWVIPNGYRYAEYNDGEAMFGGIRRDPRPEFDHVQHNQPNPILVEFRRNVAMNPDIGVGDMAAEWYERGLLLFEAERATFAHGQHARKVLTRLAAMTDVSR